uniref:Apolipoprotein M n=1 Tax=Anabas testudineus TaxID=64144 RepID=A0A3Q1I966_ANATE
SLIMSLRFSVLVLVLGLFLSSSALTPDECQPLVNPLSLADRSMMSGRFIFIAGYVNHELYRTMIKKTDSCWFTISPSPSNPDQIIFTQKNRVNGTCISSTTNVTIDGNTVKGSFANVSVVFHMLPSCDGCLLLSITSTATNIHPQLLQLMNVNRVEEEISGHTLYLLETKVKDSDLEHFKQQASCLGFSGEPDFHYDPKKEICREGEGFKMSFS